MLPNGRGKPDKGRVPGFVKGKKAVSGGVVAAPAKLRLYWPQRGFCASDTRSLLFLEVFDDCSLSLHDGAIISQINDSVFF